MSERVWNKGAPPHAGWWNASRLRATDAWRWWNGSEWSIQANQGHSAVEAADRAELRVSDQDSVEWTNYYPKNARVPRINPETSMSKNLKTQWRVQVRKSSAHKWVNKGLFETRFSARYVAVWVYREWYGFGNTRVVKYVKGSK